jgi:acetoin utilization protein AcuB
MTPQPRKSPLLADVMTSNPIGIEAHSSLAAALELMRQHDIHHLVVMDGQGPNANPESIISSSDILKVTQLGGRTLEDCELNVADICTGKAYIADSKDPLHISLQAMADSHGGTIIVLTEGALAGILTPGDACRLLATYLCNTASH